MHALVMLIHFSSADVVSSGRHSSLRRVLPGFPAADRRRGVIRVTK